MSKIDDLKQAVAKLEVDVAALSDAERDLSNWEDQDLNRRDDSSAQDARHEEMGRNESMRVREENHKIESQKALVVALTSAI